MESCLLCLEIHSDKLDCIRTDSKRWMELNIANTLEKHFWPLTTIRFNSFICSRCWRSVDDFHKFYLRVEEAHTKFVIKVEKENTNDFGFQKSGTNYSIEDANANVNIKNEPLDLDEDMESRSDISCKEIVEGRKDSLSSKKMTIINFGKCRKRKCSTETSKEIKKKSEDKNYDDSVNACDIDEDNIGVHSQPVRNSSDNYYITHKDIDKDQQSCEENDKLILDYMKQIICHICNAQLENFSYLRKHFLENHQQKAYIICCNRKFFKQEDLADHIHCHLNPNYFRCSQCDKMFSGRIFLEQHKLRDHSSEHFACDECSQLFLNVQSLEIHKFSHLPEAETNNLSKEHNKSYMSVSGNNFEEPFLEITQEINANHSDVPNTPHTLLTDFTEPQMSSTTSSVSKIQNNIKNEDIFEVLKEILRGQKECNMRIKKLEQNQTKMLQHKSMLSNGQVVIVNNQQQIADAIEKLAASIVPKPEMATQARLLTECKVSIKKVEESVSRMTNKGCDKRIKEVASMLPLQSLAAVQEVEQKLETPEFTLAMMSYLNKVKGASEDVSSVIRTLFTDDLLEKFNWEGRWEKQALGKLTLFNKTLRDVFQQQKAFDFEKSVRKEIERSHHRMNQKKYYKNK